MEVSVTKDKKGNAFIVQHFRCGCHECIFLTVEELKLLRTILNELL